MLIVLHLNSMILFKSHFPSQAFLLSDFVPGFKEMGGGSRTVLHSLHQPWCLFWAYAPALRSGSHLLTPILAPFPGSWGKGNLIGIFELFLWVSREHRNKCTLKDSIYWSYNLTLKWKSYFSNYSKAPFRSSHIFKIWTNTLVC